MKPHITDLNHGIIIRMNKKERKKSIHKDMTTEPHEMLGADRRRQENVDNTRTIHTSGVEESGSMEQGKEIPCLTSKEDTNEKEEGLCELAESMKNLYEKANLHEHLLEDHSNRLKNLMEEMKNLDNMQQAFLNEKHTTLMKTLGKTTIAWTKKMQKLNIKIDELANNYENMKKMESQKNVKHFKLMKESLHTAMAEIISKFRKHFALVQNEMNLKIKEVSKNQKSMMADISRTKVMMQKLHMESLSIQERMKSTKNHFLNLQKELEKKHMEAEIANRQVIEKVIKDMEEQARSKEQEMERRKQQWEEEKSFWEAHVKHSGDLLENLKVNIQQSYSSQLTKEKEQTTFEMQRLQNHLIERDKELALIQEQLSSVILKISKPLNRECV